MSGLYKCKFCQFISENNAIMNSHLKSHRALHMCRICMCLFYKYHDAVVHILGKHDKFRGYSVVIIKKLLLVSNVL